MYNICDSQGEDTKMQKRKFVLMVMIIMLVKGNACVPVHSFVFFFLVSFFYVENIVLKMGFVWGPLWKV